MNADRSTGADTSPFLRLAEDLSNIFSELMRFLASAATSQLFTSVGRRFCLDRLDFDFAIKQTW
jgi:hypothetical protein